MRENAPAAQVKLLRSLPEIGPVCATMLLSEMPELGRMTACQAASMVGVSPVHRDSDAMRSCRMIAEDNKCCKMRFSKPHPLPHLIVRP